MRSAKPGPSAAAELTPAQRQSLLVLRALMAACAILPLLVFTYVGWRLRETTLAAADLEVARTRDIAREHAAKVVETIERSLAEVEEIVRDRDDETLRRDAVRLHARLSRVAASLPQLKSIWVLDREGRVLANSVMPEPDATSFADRDYFVAHVARDAGVYVGPVLYPRQPYGGEPFFSMSRRRNAPDGAFAGVIQASILPSYFDRFYAQIGFEPGSLIAIARADGNLIASHPRFPPGTRLPADGPIRRQIAAAPEAGIVTGPFMIDGVERRLAYQKLPGLPLYIGAGLSLAAIRDRWLAEWSSLLVVAAPAAALLFAMLWLYLRNTIQLYAEAASRERAEGRLRERQRLEALGQLTGGVAHDFNNILTIVASSADMLRRETLAPEKRVRHLDAIGASVARGSALTRQLLAFARRQRLDPEVFDAARRTAAMEGVLTTLAGSAARVSIDASDGGCLVEADIGQFETALINLVANARDAMQNGGAISIVVRPDVAPPPDADAGAPVDVVSITVSDEGPGVAPELRKRVFEPFYTTKPVGKGTGLGLSQVFGFVKQSQGDIALDDAVGGGARFTILLPRLAGSASPPREAGEPTHPQGDGALRVLVVDDNDGVRAAVADALRARGLAVHVASDAEFALRLIEDGLDLDVVLSDVVMPGRSGVDLLADLRRLRPALPVVLGTGYSEALEREPPPDVVVLRKPYDFDHLAAVLRKAARAVAAS